MSVTTRTDRAAGSAVTFLGGFGCLAVVAMKEYPAGRRKDKKADEETGHRRVRKRWMGKGKYTLRTGR